MLRQSSFKRALIWASWARARDGDAALPCAKDKEKQTALQMASSEAVHALQMLVPHDESCIDSAGKKGRKDREREKRERERDRERERETVKASWDKSKQIRLGPSAVAHDVSTCLNV